MLATDREVRRWLDCWDAWKTLGALPRGPVLDDHPAPMVEALRRCEHALHEYQAWRTRDPEINAAHMRQLTTALGGRIVKA